MPNSGIYLRQFFRPLSPPIMTSSYCRFSLVHLSPVGGSQMRPSAFLGPRRFLSIATLGRCSLLLRTPRPILSPKRQAPAPPALRVSLAHRAIPPTVPPCPVLKPSLSHPIRLIAPIRRSRRLIRRQKPSKIGRAHV